MRYSQFIYRPSDIYYPSLVSARLTSVMVLLLIVSACTTYLGVSEFSAYRAAYLSTHESGQSILDRLAIAERKVFASSLPEPTINTADQFDPANARYFSEVVDPPATAALRRSLESIRLYNDALYGLANGESAEAMAAKLSMLATTALNAGAEVAALGSGSDPAALAKNIATSVVKPLNNFLPLAEFAYGFKTRQEFRDRLLAEKETLETLFEQLRAVTPKMYRLLVRPAVRAEDSVGGPRTLSDSAKKTLLENRNLLANWVILIEGSHTALKQAIAAIESPSAAGSIAGFTTTANELEAAARAVRGNLATLGN